MSREVIENSNLKGEDRPAKEGRTRQVWKGKSKSTKKSRGKGQAIVTEFAATWIHHGEMK